MRTQRPMNNKIFIKTAALLCHPLSIAAMILLLLNDYWLRWYAPSWWTGKLGDFGGLFFAPFALGIALAVIVPASPNQERTVKIISFGAIGIIFASAKTVPGLMALIDQILGTLLHVPVRWVSDPSDLLALASLGAAWWLWDRAVRPSNPILAPTLIAFALAAMVTLADAPAPLTGVEQINLESDSVTTYAGYKGFRSKDGGLTWIEDSTMKIDSRGGFPGSPAPQTIMQDINVQYRSTPGVSIERSEDGGKSWRVEYAFPRVSQAATINAKSISAGYGAGSFQRGPIAGVVDPRTGNAIFAMGLEGALVRKSSGEYVWVGVGNFRPLVNNPMQVLGGEVLLAINFGLLVLAMLATRAIRHWIKYVVIVFAGLLWIANFVVFAPTGYWGEASFIPLFGIFGSCAIVGIIALILTFIAARRSRGFAARIFAVAFVGAPIFFAPYYLWALDRIPTYTAAMLFALALGALVLLAGFFVSRGFAPLIKLE